MSDLTETIRPRAIPWGNSTGYDGPRKPTTRDVLAMDAELVALAEELEGEVTPEYQAKLAELEDSTDALVERCYYAKKAEEARADFHHDRIAYETATRNGHRKNAERIDGLVRLVLGKREHRRVEFEGGEVVLTRRTSVKALPHANVEALPERFRRTPKPYQAKDEPDLTAVGKALKSGESVDGYKLVEGVSYR